MIPPQDSTQGDKKAVRVTKVIPIATTLIINPMISLHCIHVWYASLHNVQ